MVGTACRTTATTPIRSMAQKASPIARQIAALRVTASRNASVVTTSETAGVSRAARLRPFDSRVRCEIGFGVLLWWQEPARVQSFAVTQEPTDRLDSALRCVDRVSFCFDGHGEQLPQTSAADMIARMLRLLDVNEGSHVLEIGTGSAFSTALLAQLAGARGAVASIDIDPDMTARAEQLLARVGYE